MRLKYLGLLIGVLFGAFLGLVISKMAIHASHLHNAPPSDHFLMIATLIYTTACLMAIFGILGYDALSEYYVTDDGDHWTVKKET